MRILQKKTTGKPCRCFDLRTPDMLKKKQQRCKTKADGQGKGGIPTKKPPHKNKGMFEMREKV